MKRVVSGLSILLVCAVKVSAVTQPDAISNLVFWVKADAGVTTNTSGKVTAWADQSGNGYDAVASTSNEPDLIVNEPGLNEMPTLRFNGTDQFMTMADRILTNGIDEFTILVMAKADVDDAVALIGIRTDGGNPLVQLDQDSTGHLRFIVRNSTGNQTANALGGVHTGTYGMYGGRLTQGSATSWSAQSYFSKTSSEGYVTGVNFSADPYLTSGDQFIGRVVTRYWDGDIAEIMIFERSLIDSELNEIQEYLASRYQVNTCVGESEPAVDEVPGLSMWLRADSCVFEDVYANDPADNLDIVKVWGDSSVETHDAVGSETPTIVVNKVNGLPAIGFTPGSVDRLYLRDDPITTDPDQMVIFAVFSQSVGDKTMDMVFTHRNEGTQLIQASVKDGINAILQMRGSGGSLQTITAPGVYTNGAFSVVMYQFDIVNDRHAIAVNGGAEVVSTYDFGNQTFIADTQRIGYYYGGLNFAGFMAEVIVYNGVALSHSQKNQVGYYLEKKYGLDTGYAPVGTMIMIQ